MTRGFTLVRLLEATPAEAFRAWTDPNKLGWFFSGNRSTLPDPIAVDLAVNGAWRQLMIVDDYTQYVTGGVYREIVTNEKLVFAWGAVGGWPELSSPDAVDGPLVTLTFTQLETVTRLALAVSFDDSVSDERVDEWLAAGIERGWNQTLDRLVSLFG
jgi:uncharacterized protein YndB with AHSA1/START domain